MIKINKRLRFTGAILAIAAAMSLTVYAAAEIRTYNQADILLNGIGIDPGTLTRGEAKLVYRDIDSGAFQKEATKVYWVKRLRRWA